MPSPIRILHLDDNPGDARLVAFALEVEQGKFPTAVHYVQTKEEYLAALAARDFDLILSDYRMPAYDGDQALQAAREICPDIPFIMVTGELGEERAIETLRHGATDYVLKDRILRLIPAIKRALVEAERERRSKQADRALRESEDRVRRKLKSILSPEGDLAELELIDLIDIPALQKLMDDFHAVTNLPIGVLDVKGNVLVSVGWQEICTHFHRAHKESCKNCLRSDTELSAGVLQGEFRLYKCKNNLWDIATPIMVGGQHMGNIFSGQFFFDDETIDRVYFTAQARRFGFIEKEYLTALDRVPRLSHETVNRGMAFLMKLAETLSQLGYSNVKLARTVAERDRLTTSLQVEQERLKRAQEIAHLGSWELDVRTATVIWSDEVYRIFGLEPQASGATYEAYLEFVHPEDRARVHAAHTCSVRENKDSYEIEYRVVRKSQGEIRYVRERCQHIRDASGRIVGTVGLVQDITDRVGNAENPRVEKKGPADRFPDHAARLSPPLTRKGIFPALRESAARLFAKGGFPTG